LEHFYEAQEVIKAIRSPIGRADEGKTRKRSEAETHEESEILDQAYVVFERYEARKDIFAKIRALKFRFMATFGRGAREPFDELNDAIHKIFVAARLLGRHYWPRQGRVPMSPEEFQKHLERMHELEAVFWDASDEDDQLGGLIDRAIQKLRATRNWQLPPTFRYGVARCNE
jgi:hypothetical protein